MMTTQLRLINDALMGLCGMLRGDWDGGARGLGPLVPRSAAGHRHALCSDTRSWSPV